MGKRRRSFGGIPPAVRQSVIFVVAVGGLIYSAVKPPAQAVIVGACLVLLGYPIFDSLDMMRRKVMDAASDETETDR